MENSHLRKAAWIMVVALGFSPLLLKGAESADYRVDPSIRLGQGWDSNIFQTNINEVSDFYATVTPALVFTAAKPTLSMQLLGSVEGRWYYDHPEISSAGYTKNARLTSVWSPTARFSVSPAAYFLETRDQTARSSLNPVDPTVPSSGIATYGLEKSRDFGASIGLLYRATPTVEATGMVYGAAHQYPDQPERVSDSQSVGADVSVRYIFSPRSYAGAYVNGSKEMFKETPDSQVFGVGLLGGNQISSAFRTDGRLGMEFVRQHASSPGGSDLTESDFAGNVSLSYTDNTFRANLYVNVEYTGLSGAGEITRTGTVGINLSDQFTQRWSWYLNGNYQNDLTVFTSKPIDQYTLNGTGSIRYAPWEWGVFDLTGNATREESDVPSGDLTRYTVVLGVTLRNTYTTF